MRSTGVLGGTALVAIVVAAICFAVVDASTTGSRLCEQAVGSCAEPVFAAYTGWFAAVGAVGLAAAIVPAIIWLSRILRQPAQAPDDVTVD